MAANEDYADYPEHPLHGVPQDILKAMRNAASGVLQLDWQMAHAKDRDHAADAMLAAIMPAMRTWLDWESVGVREIADRCHVSRSTVASWALGRRGSGGFPAQRGGRSGGHQWAWRDVEDWLQGSGLGHYLSKATHDSE